jgi:hypothetical protein
LKSSTFYSISPKVKVPGGQSPTLSAASAKVWLMLSRWGILDDARKANAGGKVCFTLSGTSLLG